MEELNKQGNFLQLDCDINYTHVIISSSEHNIHDFDSYVNIFFHEANLNNLNPKLHDSNQFIPNFGFVPANRILKQ